MIRCRLVARDLQSNTDKGRKDLFAATTPLESKGLLLSRTVCRRNDKRVKKLFFINARCVYESPSRGKGGKVQAN